MPRRPKTLYAILLLAAAIIGSKANLAEDVLQFVNSEDGATFADATLTEFVFAIVLLFFLRPFLTFRTGTRHGGVRVRERAGVSWERSFRDTFQNILHWTPLALQTSGGLSHSCYRL